MENYKKVHQWTATLTVSDGLKELQAAKAKFPWLKVDQALEALQRLDKDLPAVVQILKLQEKQNAIHRKCIEVSKIADTAITQAIIKKFNIDLDGTTA